MATAAHDDYARKSVPIEPITGKEYYMRVEKVAGRCWCLGKYRMNAPPCCPKCHSTEYKEVAGGMLYG
jgi:Zn finger protein HypA/HybF involved in hydrogenase expression